MNKPSTSSPKKLRRESLDRRIQQQENLTPRITDFELDDVVSILQGVRPENSYDSKNQEI